MNYLVTGVAGTGKSTIAGVLQSRGYTAVDADDAEFCHWVERATGKSYNSRPDTKNWVSRFDWQWKEDRMRQLLAKDTAEPQFICGIAHNQASFYPSFEKIFLLSASPDVISHRLETRTNNPFGKRPGDIEQTLSWQKEFEAQVKQVRAIVINSERSAAEVVDDILGQLNDN